MFLNLVERKNFLSRNVSIGCSSINGKQLLCLAHGQGQKNEQKHTTKDFFGLVS